MEQQIYVSLSVSRPPPSQISNLKNRTKTNKAGRPLPCPGGARDSLQIERSMMRLAPVISNTAHVGNNNICDRGQQPPSPFLRLQRTGGRVRSLQQIFVEPFLCVRPCSPEQSSRNYFLKRYTLPFSMAISKKTSPLHSDPSVLKLNYASPSSMIYFL